MSRSQNYKRILPCCSILKSSGFNIGHTIPFHDQCNLQPSVRVWLQAISRVSRTSLHPLLRCQYHNRLNEIISSIVCGGGENELSSVWCDLRASATTKLSRICYGFSGRISLVLRNCQDLLCHGEPNIPWVKQQTLRQRLLPFAIYGANFTFRTRFSGVRRSLRFQLQAASSCGGVLCVCH